MDAEAQGAGQGHGALIPEAEGSGSLALPVVGLVDALEERRADGTALAGTFDHKQTVADLAGLGHEFVEVLDATQDVEVLGLVHDGFDTKGRLPSFKYCLTLECCRRSSPDCLLARLHCDVASQWCRCQLKATEQ